MNTEYLNRRACRCTTPILPVPSHYPRNPAHTRYHRHWANGVPLCPTAFPGVTDGVGIVTTKSSKAEWDRARALAVILRNEAGHSGALWNRRYGPRPKKSTDPYQTTAFIAIRERAAIGIAIVRSVDIWGYQRQGHTDYIREGHSYRKPCIDGLFICVNCRRQGIASHLVQAVATHYDLSASDLAWTGPLSEGGRAIAWATSGTEGKLCRHS